MMEMARRLRGDGGEGKLLQARYCFLAVERQLLILHYSRGGRQAAGSRPLLLDASLLQYHPNRFRRVSRKALLAGRQHY